MDADGANSGESPHLPMDAAAQPSVQSQGEEWGRVTDLDGRPICEGRVTFRTGENVLVHVSSWSERSIREPQGVLHYQNTRYTVELLYYTDNLLAAVIDRAVKPKKEK